jgi:hypothetical protein
MPSRLLSSGSSTKITFDVMHVGVSRHMLLAMLAFMMRPNL